MYHIHTIITLLTSLVLLAGSSVKGQAATQTIRGIIVDQQSKTALSSVTVMVTEGNRSTITDSSGAFVLAQVPLGRVGITVSHIAYEPLQLSNIVVEAGKETILNLEMLEKLGSTRSVTITGRKSGLASRQMATVSATEFNAEDSRRFAGSRNDVARMAANFAGATSNNDGRNDIIIRGNSPTGLLWRLEGVDIPNPNHYGSFGATGGPVSMLNNNVLGQSAFYTGAFPAQFGNATAGAFDINLRNGNNQQTEFTAQVGYNGLELGAEGPFSKKSKASYLVYYRYSIPGLLKSLGADVGTGAAVPSYQDISLKIQMPTKKAGQFTLFGVGGTSSIDFKGDLKDTANFYNDPYSNLYNATKMGVVGLSHSYFFNSTTSSKITIAATGSQVITRQDSLDIDRQPHKNYRQNGNEWRYVVSAVFNKKFSASDRLTAGATLDQLYYSYADSLRDSEEGFIPFLQEKNRTQLVRGYAQWQHRFSKAFTLNTGVYSQYLTLNKKWAVESRMGAAYALRNGGSFSLAYGMHSQMQSLMTYFNETKIEDAFIQTNRELDFTKSQHIVTGWQQPLRNGWRYKAEAYMQLISKAPVETKPSAWSGLNMGAGYGDGWQDSLVNNGKGYNYGLELTVEKPFANGYYVLTTVSVFDSKYKGSNGIKHNTAFNGRYVVNLLGGKEWQLKGIHTIGVDIRLTAAGGKRYTPINVVESKLAQKAVFDDDKAFTEKMKDYFRTDIKLTYRMNNKGFMQEFFVDFQNITNTRNAFGQWYDSRAQKIRTTNQLGFYPNFNYRIQF